MLYIMSLSKFLPNNYKPSDKSHDKLCFHLYWFIGLIERKETVKFVFDLFLSEMDMTMNKVGQKKQL